MGGSGKLSIASLIGGGGWLPVICDPFKLIQSACLSSTSVFFLLCCVLVVEEGTGHVKCLKREKKKEWRRGLTTHATLCSVRV